MCASLSGDIKSMTFTYVWMYIKGKKMLKCFDQGLFPFQRKSIVTGEYEPTEEESKWNDGSDDEDKEEEDKEDEKVSLRVWVTVWRWCGGVWVWGCW